MRKPRTSSTPNWPARALSADQEREQLLADAKQGADQYREQARRAVDATSQQRIKILERLMGVYRDLEAVPAALESAYQERKNPPEVDEVVPLDQNSIRGEPALAGRTVSAAPCRSGTPRLSAAQARRIAVAAQGFSEPRGGGPITRGHLKRLISRIEVLQMDSVSVAVRAHYALGVQPAPPL